MIARLLVSITALLLVPGMARAEVVSASDAGFVVSGEVAVAGASPQDAWQALLQPGTWWSDAHTWSGHAANMTLDPVAGGCFCEMLPAALPDGTAGSVEHMRVIHIRPQAQLVMRGGLGPLQGEALIGVLTITLAEEGEGVSLRWTYLVGGYARFPLPAVAPVVDGVLAEQMGRLKVRLEGNDPA